MKTNGIPILLIVLFTLFSCKNDKDDHLFTRLTPDETGIRFNNINAENEQINIFTYEYLYNGAGVAVGDINNDGLADIYFSSNNLENKLYLNKGNLNFEDITSKSGAGCKPGWKTGVSMVDINADGLLDIYVCRSADSHPENRKNSLLINNGNLTFTDKANEYGLDDNSYSTQGIFFDCDLDGDLDVFLLNHSLLQISNSFDIGKINRNIRYPYIGNRMLRNDNGHFTDVSEAAGIPSLSSNYGLGGGVADFNNDGWPDLYASNDYVDNDKLYLNNKDGTFTDVTDSLLTHTSQFSMGMDIADVNRDGLLDILTLDMLPEDNKRQKLLFGPDRYDVFATSVKNGYHYQYMRNMLQLNNGDGTFSEIGQLAGISNTDWSWSALLADYDNDGWQDLFVSNGYKRDFTNNDFLKYKADQQLKMQAGGKGSYSEMMTKIPSNKLHNYIFKNNGDLTFRDACVDWGFTDKTLTNGAAYADLDNDGDLDLVMNNIDEMAGVYRNNADKLLKRNYLKVRLKGTGKNTSGIGARVSLYSKGKLQMKEMSPVRGFQSSVDPLIHVGLDTVSIIDSLIVIWPDHKKQKLVNIKANQLLIIKQAEGSQEDYVQPPEKTFFTESRGIQFSHNENEYIDFKTQALLPRMYSTQGPASATADVNGDGYEDIFIGGAKNQAGELFLQTSDGNFRPVKTSVFLQDAISEDVDAIFFDMDHDNDQDLYVVSGGYEYAPDDIALQDRIYRNDGKGNFEKIKNALPTHLVSGSCVRSSDIDNDGDLDLFVGGRISPGRYPETPESAILINDGKGNFADATNEIAPEIKKIGMVADARWVDLDKDSREDLVVVGEWMRVEFYTNENGKLTDQSAQAMKGDNLGWWNCVSSADIDNDGDVDLVLGNFGLNNQLKPSMSHPVTLDYADYDNNGSVDPLLCYYIQGKSYPYANRDELTDQLPGFKKRFTDYESYSEATLEKILKPEELRNSVKLAATNFQSCIAINHGDGTFTLKPLPLQAQYAPVFAIRAVDVNGDNKTDLITAGNLDKTRVRTGKFSGNTGFVFLGDGTGNFQYVPQLVSGLKVQGDVRHIEMLDTRIIFIRNNADVKIFRLSNEESKGQH
jgi:hypothetical protein